ncbi:unnamed protein product [Ascophyllum nodosum]
MFFISIQQAFNALNTSMRLFPPERSLMIRERSTGSYRVGPYFLAKSTSDLGIYTLAPILYATVIYWSVGLRPEAGAFFIFLLLFMGEVKGAEPWLLISTAISDVFTAQSFSFVLVLGLMLFGERTSIYSIIQNFTRGSYLSFLFYGFGGLLYNELYGREYSCDAAEGKALAKRRVRRGLSRVGDEILTEYGFQDVNVWENIAVLAGMIVGFRLWTYLIMRHSTKLRT